MNKFINEIKYGSIDSNINKDEYKNFKSTLEAEKWGMQYYRKWGKHYLNSMKATKGIIKENGISNSIEYYCGETYRWINQYLRTGIDNSLSKTYANIADTLTIILCLAPRVSENIIVYRLVNNEFIERLIEANKQGIWVQENGFLSTSLTENIVNNNEYYSSYNNLLKIYVKSNTVGVYVNAVTKRQEEELLLAPNGYLKLLEYPYKKNNRFVYECELIYANSEL